MRDTSDIDDLKRQNIDDRMFKKKSSLIYKFSTRTFLKFRVQFSLIIVIIIIKILLLQFTKKIIIALWFFEETLQIFLLN